MNTDGSGSAATTAATSPPSISPPHFTLNNYVGEVAVISMNDARLEKTNQQMESIHTIYKVFDGISATPADIRQQGGNCKMLCPAKSATGIWMAHRQIWEYMIHKGLPTVAIFEDDVVFTKDIASRLPAAMTELPPDWDIFYLGCLTCNSPSLLDIPICRKASIPFSQHLQIPSCVFGTEAYVLSRKGAQKLLETLKAEKGTVLHLDVWIQKYQNTIPPLFQIYALKPPVAFQNHEGFRNSSNKIPTPILLNHLVNLRYHPSDAYDGRTVSWLLSIQLAEIPPLFMIITGWWFVFFIFALLSNILFYGLALYLAIEILWMLTQNRMTIASLRGYVSLYIALLLGRGIRWAILRN
jgi:GR25 family glycosyltransferase involved in LPS biosynthesis